MKALIFRRTGSLENLKVEELPTPTPKAGEVLVQVVAAAINPSDAKNVMGKMSETTVPRIPGRDFAGRVVAGDSHWSGKSVFGTGGNLGIGRDGSHAEFMTVPVDALVETPPEFSDESAASIGVIYLAAYAAIVQAGEVKNGETVLVTGRRVRSGLPQRLLRMRNLLASSEPSGRVENWGHGTTFRLWSGSISNLVPCRNR